MGGSWNPVRTVKGAFSSPGGLLNFATLGVLGDKPQQAQAPIIIQTPAPSAGGGGGGGGQGVNTNTNTPDTGPASKPSDNIPSPGDKEIAQAKKRQRLAAKAGGRSRTILTGGRGLGTSANTTKKVLLGQ